MQDCSVDENCHSYDCNGLCQLFPYKGNESLPQFIYRCHTNSTFAALQLELFGDPQCILPLESIPLLSPECGEPPEFGNCSTIPSYRIGTKQQCNGTEITSAPTAAPSNAPTAAPTSIESPSGEEFTSLDTSAATKSVIGQQFACTLLVLLNVIVGFRLEAI